MGSRSSMAVVILASPKTCGKVSKCEISGDEQRRVFLEFPDHMEQQLAAGLAELANSHVGR